MSETAETDMVVAADTGDSGFIRNLVQLARSLERERDEARRERDEALKSREAVWNSWNKALEERDEARRELNEALQRISEEEAK